MRQLQKLCETYGNESPECNLPEYPKRKEDLDIVSDPFRLETFGLNFALAPCRVTGETDCLDDDQAFVDKMVAEKASATLFWFDQFVSTNPDDFNANSVNG